MRVKIKQWSTDSPINALAYGNGVLYAGGDFEAAGDKAIDLIAAWDGANWNEVAGGIANEGYDKVYALVAGADHVIAGGYFRTIAAKRVDNSIFEVGDRGGEVGSYVNALAVVGDNVYIGGHFQTIQFGTNTGAAQARYIARFDTQTNQWVGLGSGLRWYNDLYTTAYSVIALPSGVYMAGEFDRAGEKAAMGFARWAGALGAPNLTPGQGGTAQANGARATFPAGAVGENSVATLAVTTKPVFALPNGKAGVFGVQIGATIVTGKQLAQTSKPYTVQVQFTDGQLAAAGIADPSSLQLVMWDGNAWQPLQSNVDLQNKLVTGATDQFRPLALVGNLAGGEDGGQGKGATA